jgi:hypothetical protein
MEQLAKSSKTHLENSEQIQILGLPICRSHTILGGDHALGLPTCKLFFLFFSASTASCNVEVTSFFWTIATVLCIIDVFKAEMLTSIGHPTVTQQYVSRAINYLLHVCWEIAKTRWQIQIRKVVSQWVTEHAARMIGGWVFFACGIDHLLIYE